MSEAWNKERNEFFLRDLNCMNNPSLAFLVKKVGMWKCFSFFCEATVREKRGEISISVISILTAAGDKFRQLLRLLLLSYDETHGMLGLLHVLLLLMYSCIKCPTLILLGLVSYPAFFVSSRNAPTQSTTAA